jgi:hypothetical protein
MQSIQASAGTQARRTVRPFEMSALERALERGRLAELTGEVVLNAPAAAQTNLAREFRWLSAARARGFVISSGSSQNSTAVSSAHSITDISRSTMRPSIQFSPPAVASVALPIDPQDLRSAQLSNGMRIVALKTGHFPLVAFSLLVPGGDSVSTPPELPPGHRCSANSSNSFQGSGRRTPSARARRASMPSRAHCRFRWRGSKRLSCGSKRCSSGVGMSLRRG